MARNPIATRLWAINISSITATTATYLWCSYMALVSTGSLFFSGAIFALQWSGSILFFGAINDLFGRHAIKTVVTTALAVIVVAMPFGALTSVSLVPFVLAFVVGTCETVVKISRLLVIKRFVRPTEIGHVNSMSSTGQFIGGALGGILFSTATAVDGRFVLPAIATALVAVALIASTGLPSGMSSSMTYARQSSFDLLRRIGSQLQDHRALRNAIVGLVATCGLLQGFHNAARVGLPIESWNAGQAVVGYLQAIVAVSTVLGALVYMKAERQIDGHRMVVPVGFLTVAAMTSASLLSTPLLGLVVYALYIFGFELVFMHFQTEVVTRTPSDAASNIISFQFLMINVAMFTAGLLGAYLAEQLGYLATALIYGGAFLAIVGRAHRKTSTASPGGQSKDHG